MLYLKKGLLHDAFSLLMLAVLNFGSNARLLKSLLCPPSLFPHCQTLLACLLRTLVKMVPSLSPVSNWWNTMVTASRSSSVSSPIGFFFLSIFFTFSILDFTFSVMFRNSKLSGRSYWAINLKVIECTRYKIYKQISTMKSPLYLVNMIWKLVLSDVGTIQNSEI